MTCVWVGGCSGPPSIGDWLLDDDEIRRFLSYYVRNHSRTKADHSGCRRKTVELLIAWIDYTRTIIRGQTPEGDLYVPSSELLSVRTPEMRIRRSRWGAQLVGSGSVISQAVEGEFIELADIGRGTQFGDSHRCVMTGILVRDELVKVGITTVGGQYQMAHLSPRGVEVVPYMYWVPVEPGYGTYVAMRLEDGYWVQEHRPTRTKIRLMNPWEIHLAGPSWQAGQHQMFDPSRSLTRHSPGVIPEEKPWQVVAWLYEPGEAPPPIRPSWGDEPLPPLAAERPPPVR